LASLCQSFEQLLSSLGRSIRAQGLDDLH
jgi:hypothetical protein